MSDPDVIWSYAKFDGARIFHKKPNIPDMPTEYRRANLPPTDAEVMAHPKVQALVEASGDLLEAYESGWRDGQDWGAGKRARAALAAIQEAKP